MDLAKLRLSLPERSRRSLAANIRSSRRFRPSRTVLQPGDRVCRALQMRNSKRAGIGILSLEHRKLDKGAISSMMQSTPSRAALSVPYWTSCKKDWILCPVPGIAAPNSCARPDLFEPPDDVPLLLLGTSGVPTR